MTDEQTESPTLADALNWSEERGDLPEQFASLPLDDIRTLVTERESAVTRSFEERQAAERERERAAAAAAATSQDDIAYWQGLRSRLASEDAETATAARSEFLQNEDRYNRGAAAHQAGSKAVMQQEVLRDFFTGMNSELTAAGFADVIPEVGSASWMTLASRLREYDGKGGIGAYLIDYGRQLERVDATDAAETAARAAAAAEGAGAGMGNGGAVSPRSNYSDTAWVKAQMDADPEWSFKVSDDGKLTNLQRVRSGAVRSLRAS